MSKVLDGLPAKESGKIKVGDRLLEVSNDDVMMIYHYMREMREKGEERVCCYHNYASVHSS